MPEITQLIFISWQQPVLNLLTTPPGGETLGDRYLVTAVAAGAWAGEENNIATYDGTAWWFITPVEGCLLHDNTSNNYMKWDGAAWRVHQLLPVGNQTNAMLRWDGTDWVQGSAQLTTGNDMGLYGGASEDNSFGVYHAGTLHAQYGINALEELYVQWRNGVAAPEYKNTYDQVTNIVAWSYDDGGGLDTIASLDLSDGSLTVTGNLALTGVTDPTASFTDAGNFLRHLTSANRLELGIDGTARFFVTSAGIQVQGSCLPAQNDLRTLGAAGSEWSDLRTVLATFSGAVNMATTLAVVGQATVGSLEVAAGGPVLSQGAGTPEGAVAAGVGSIFMRNDGGAGTSMYVKETGTGNTGWVGK